MSYSPTHTEARNLWIALRQISLLRRAALAFPADADEPACELEGIVLHTDRQSIRQKAFAALNALQSRETPSLPTQAAPSPR